MKAEVGWCFDKSKSIKYCQKTSRGKRHQTDLPSQPSEGANLTGGASGKEPAYQCRNIILPRKICIVRTMVFPVVKYGYELDHKESWAPKNWYF